MGLDVGATYLYSKPCGFQRLEKHKPAGEQEGQRHDLGQSAPPLSSVPAYNMVDLIRPKDPSQLLDDSFPEFLGTVALEKTLERGRGVFATSDIAPGDLIVASRALAIVFPESSPSPSGLWPQVLKLSRLRQELGALAEADPSKASQIYHLYAGPQLGYLEPGEGNDADLGMERIERICSFNAFQGSVQGYAADSCFGLWYFPSFFNHDCLGANARWTIYKNFMFVRAHRPIKKGDEVLISYVDPNDSASFRRNFFLKHEFFCQCALCRLERSESQSLRRRREIILDDFRRQDSEGRVTTVESLIEELESLRSKEGHLNIFLIQPLLDAAFQRYEGGHYEEALPFFLRAFDLCAISSQISLLCVSCAFTIATCFVRRSKMALAAHWLTISKECVWAMYGTLDIIPLLRPAFFAEMTSHNLL